MGILSFGVLISLGDVIIALNTQAYQGQRETPLASSPQLQPKLKPRPYDAKYIDPSTVIICAAIQDHAFSA